MDVVIGVTIALFIVFVLMCGAAAVSGRNPFTGSKL